MKNYIEIERLKKEVPFVNFAITTKNIDSKSIDDLNKTFIKNEFTLKNLTSNIQVHSDIVNAVDYLNIGNKDEGDALVTNIKNVPLLIFTADCVPVAIIDKNKKVIGLAHAGWKGTYAEIAKKTIEKMKELYKSSPEDLICIIGPSIGECCYEVSEELYNKFKDKFKSNIYTLYEIKEDKYYLNLQNINRYSLKSIGVKDENIIDVGICTNCNSDKFYSYRAHDKTPCRIGTILEIIQ